MAEDSEHATAGHASTMRWLAVSALAALALGCAGDSLSPSYQLIGSGVNNTAPPTLEVLPTSASIVVGASVQLSAAAHDKDGVAVASASFTWKSEHPTIASVDATGRVTGVSAGSTFIQASALGQSIQSLVTVTATQAAASAASVTLTPSTAALLPGGALRFVATARDAAGTILTGRPVTWSSGAPAIASVDSTGSVRALSEGDTNITAAVDGQSASARLSVLPVPAASVSLTPGSGSILVGTSLRLSATARDSAGNVLSRPIRWTSSAPGVATVDSTGLVQGLGAGVATITASADGKSASADVTVRTVPVAVVTVSPGSGSVAPYASLQLTATTTDSAGNVLTGRVVSWSSSAPAVATVNGFGAVTGLSAGSATITATSEGKSGSAAITVGSGGTTPPPAPVTAASVTVSPTTATVAIGSTTQLTATPRDSAGNPLTGRTITWSSSAAGVASVNGSGLVSGVAAGSATVTATVDGKSASATITVPTPTAASVAVSPTSASLTVGGTTQLTATPKDASGNVLTGRPTTWSSSASAIATVSTSGLVTAMAAGSATITVTVDGKTATSVITVTAPPPPPAPGSWPNNEPSGLTQLLSADGSSKYYFAPHSNVFVGGKWSDATIYPAANNGTRVQVVADPQSKFGNVVQKWTFTGEQSGFNAEYDWQGAPGFGNATGYKEMYFRIVFEFASAWQWEVAHTQKLFYFATNRTNQSGGGNANSFFISVDRNQIDFVDQANPTSATTWANGDGTRYNIDYRYTPPAGMIAAGKYITVELWIRPNSSPTTADGQARIWINGTEISANMTALMGAYVGQKGLANRIWTGDTKFFGTGSAYNGNFNNMQTLLYWGGTGDTAASNFYFNLSELFISGVAG